MSRYRTVPPNRWVIPSVVGASVVAGAVSVPLVLMSGAISVGPDALTTASASPRTSVATTSPSKRRSASSSLALAGQPPPGGESGSKVREVKLGETSGAPGSKVVVTGHCISGVDTAAAAGIGGLGVAGAVSKPLTSSGTFSLTLRAPRSSGDIALAVACLNGSESTSTWHLVYRVLKADATSTPSGSTSTTGSPSSPAPTDTGSSTGTSSGGTSSTSGQTTGQQTVPPQSGGGSSTSTS
jgi:hypothetical protein